MTGHPADGGGPVGRMRSDDMRLKAVEIDLDDLKEIPGRVGEDLGIGPEEIGVSLGQVRGLLPTAALEVVLHAQVEGKE